MDLRFRAWDKVYEHFHEEDIVRDYCLGDFIDNPEYEVIQYTGLQDKNGILIYVGDILREEVETGEIITQVVFHNFAFKEKLISSPFNHLNTYFEFGKENSYEVIGNIYENPELLYK